MQQAEVVGKILSECKKLENITKSGHLGDLGFEFHIKKIRPATLNKISIKQKSKFTF